jgi:hypothetical protein
MLADQRRLSIIALLFLLMTALPIGPAFADEPVPPSPTVAPTEEVLATPTEAPPTAGPTEPPPPAPTEAPPTAVPTELPPSPTVAPTEPPPNPTAAPPAAPQPTAAPERPRAPTFRIFATRQGLVGRRTANGHIIQPRDRFVALPAWKALSSRGGKEFQVRLTYKGHSVVVPVWDVGPWNTRDDYWSPDRYYKKVPVGVPMAQYAHQEGYNGGRDEFGRRIGLPNGIDIADGAFWDDLGMKQSDWVEVTFLWMGNDPGVTEAAPKGNDVVEVEPDAIVVDDGGDGYSSSSISNWYDGQCGAGGRHAWTYAATHESQRENSARWAPKLSGNNFYEVFAYIPSCGKQATQSASYRVLHEGAVTVVRVNQQEQAGHWASLGVFKMDGDSAIELDDLTGEVEDVVVRFDAIKFVPRTDSAPPDARVIEATRREDGSILIRWQGTDDVSGVASFDVQFRRLDDDDWTDWLAGVAVSEAAFTPEEPGGFAFRARARDWAGHEQPWRDEGDVAIE